MKIEEMHEEIMFALFAPDGAIQLMTLAPDVVSCIAQIKVMHKRGLCQSFHELIKVKGFEILPVIVTIREP